MQEEGTALLAGELLADADGGDGLLHGLPLPLPAAEFEAMAHACNPVACLIFPATLRQGEAGTYDTGHYLKPGRLSYCPFQLAACILAALWQQECG